LGIGKYQVSGFQVSGVVSTMLLLLVSCYLHFCLPAAAFPDGNDGFFRSLRRPTLPVAA